MPDGLTGCSVKNTAQGGFRDPNQSIRQSGFRNKFTGRRVGLFACQNTKLTVLPAYVKAALNAGQFIRPDELYKCDLARAYLRWTDSIAGKIGSGNH